MNILSMITFLLCTIIVLDIIMLLFNFAICVILRRFDIKRQAVENSDNESNETALVTVRPKLSIKRIIGSLVNRYGFVRYSFIICSHIPSYKIRNWIYRYVFLMKITKNTIIMGGCEVRSPWNFTADRCSIGSNCILDARAGISFGEDVCLGSGVHIWTMEHDLYDPYFRVTCNHSCPVSIENHSWICSDSTILPGVKIGQGCVIAARACVTKDCESFTIYGGCPAKKIGVRPKDLRYHIAEKPFWCFY